MTGHIATIVGRLLFAALALAAIHYLPWEKFLLWVIVVVFASSRLALKPIEQSFAYLKYLKEKLEKQKPE